MGADDSTVNDEILGIRVIGQALVERGPDAAVAPGGVALADGVSFAVLWGRKRHGALERAIQSTAATKRRQSVSQLM